MVASFGRSDESAQIIATQYEAKWRRGRKVPLKRMDRHTKTAWCCQDRLYRFIGGFPTAAHHKLAGGLRARAPAGPKYRTAGFQRRGCPLRSRRYVHAMHVSGVCGRRLVWRAHSYLNPKLRLASGGVGRYMRVHPASIPPRMSASISTHTRRSSPPARSSAIPPRSGRRRSGAARSAPRRASSGAQIVVARLAVRRARARASRSRASTFSARSAAARPC